MGKRNFPAGILLPGGWRNEANSPYIRASVKQFLPAILMVSLLLDNISKNMYYLNI